MDELLQQIERLAAANQALTQRLDREHSMRLAAEERASELASKHVKGFDIGSIDPGMRAMLLGAVGEASLVAEKSRAEVVDDLERRAHEAEAALEALRADVERDRASIRYRLPDVSGTMGQVAIYSVCELLAAWGRAQDVEHCRETRRQAVLFHRSAKEAIERATDALYGGR